MNEITINFLPAGYGDCFLIKFDNNKTLLIDGGTRETMSENSKRLENVFGFENNYILLTHVDSDHIGGINLIFEQYENIYKRITSVIYNTFSDLKKFTPNAMDEPPTIKINDSKMTSYTQGKFFEDKLRELNIPVCSNLIAGMQFSIDDININILSPSISSMEKYKSWEENKSRAYTTKMSDYHRTIDELYELPFIEKKTVTNSSSISVIIEYKSKKLLFLGDSAPSDVVNSLVDLGYSKDNKLKVDIVKVAHHGSRHNTSNELLEMILCNKFLISTDGKTHKHPDKESLSRIICLQNNPELIFNYDIYRNIFSCSEIESSRFTIKVQSEVII